MNERDVLLAMANAFDPVEGAPTAQEWARIRSAIYEAMRPSSSNSESNAAGTCLWDCGNPASDRCICGSNDKNKCPRAAAPSSPSEKHSESPTPRTDAAAFTLESIYKDVVEGALDIKQKFVTYDFAHQLELKLAAKTEEADHFFNHFFKLSRRYLEELAAHSASVPLVHAHTRVGATLQFDSERDAIAVESALTRTYVRSVSSGSEKVQR